MAKKIFSFEDVEVHEKTVDTLAKYKELLEGPFAEALEKDEISKFAVKIHEAVPLEDRAIVLAFVQMVICIHRFSQVGGE